MVLKSGNTETFSGSNQYTGMEQFNNQVAAAQENATGDITESAVSNSNTVSPPVGANQSNFQKKIEARVDSLKTQAGLLHEYTLAGNECFRIAVNKRYKEIREEDDKLSIGDRWVDKKTKWGFEKDLNKPDLFAGKITYNRDPEFVKNALRNCLRSQSAKDRHDGAAKNSNNKTSTEREITNENGGPFDKRLYRDYTTLDNKRETRIPFSVQYAEAATAGLFMGDKYFMESDTKSKEEVLEKLQNARKKLQKDTFYIGVPALQNTYALVKLYGSEGGKTLMNQRNNRRWYEVDQAFSEGRADLANFSSNPTTSSLITWGNADPYGRTPYHFTDFVFAKYWNKIENNRLITLRRYGAPILDNLKFPGMDGITSLGEPGAADNTNDNGGEGTTEKGSGGKITFPPMAQAITYFGEETGNNLSDLLKFTTGVNWGEVKSDVWQVTAESTPDSESGPSGVFKPYAGVSTAVLVFTKGDRTDKVWFYDMEADGYSL